MSESKCIKVLSFHSISDAGYDYYNLPVETEITKQDALLIKFYI